MTVRLALMVAFVVSFWLWLVGSVSVGWSLAVVGVTLVLVVVVPSTQRRKRG